VFGLVGTLQNVAVISSWQIMPVLGSGELFVVPPPLSACCCDCAATGDVAKSSAVINASLFMCALVVLSPTRRSRTLAAIGMFHHDAAYEAALRALNTAANVRPFVLYFNLMDHARAPLPAEIGVATIVTRRLACAPSLQNAGAVANSGTNYRARRASN